jgi:tRNA(Ile)-lysidine synthase
MANSRNSRSRNKASGLQVEFERALGDILARVCVSATAGSAKPSVAFPAVTEGSATPLPVTENRPSIAVAYSGGLDSSVLLHLASEYARTHELPIYAFHIHHGLSPNADAWLAHCQAESDRCGATFAAAKVDVAGNGGRGVEEAARIARYAGLGNLCRRHSVSLLLTAHHQDDQAETVLLQLMRGAGLPGLSGMPAFQQHHDLLGAGIALGRPLLGIARATLEQAALRFGLQHVGDESNADTRYRRNALRHDIAPVIETHFPGFASLVARTAEHAQSAQSLLHQLAMIDLAACKADALNDALDLHKVKSLPAERADNLLRHWLYGQGVKLPSTSRLDEIRAQMFGAASDMHPFFDFGPVTLRRIGNRLELHPGMGTPPCDPLTLQWQGQHEVLVPQWRGRLVFDKVDGPGLDAARLRNRPLVLHPRAGQERLRVAANRPSKSLKSLFQESSIAPWRRSWLPLIYLDTDLVFVAGLGMDARHLIPGESVSLRWEME